MCNFYTSWNNCSITLFTIYIKSLYTTFNNNELNNNSKIFLAIVLIAGIIVLFSLSFMVCSTQVELENELGTQEEIIWK